MSDLLRYSIDSFAFVLPRNGVFTFGEWVDQIENSYRAANLTISSVVAEIRKFEGGIIRNNGRTEIKLS